MRRLNVDGDGQGDRDGHGGEQRAVLVYQRESLEHWRRFLGRDSYEYGQFGENFTVEGLPDDEVCIGDRYRIGEAEFEVTQPRVTCYRVGLRLDAPAMPALLVAHRRPGFYLRVIVEGRVQAGDEIIRIRHGRHAMTVAEIDALLYLPGRDIARLRDAVDIPALSPGWQQSFRDLLAGGASPPVGVEPGWKGFRPLTVTGIHQESSTVISVRLAAAEGAALPDALPGQYVTVRVAGAAEPAPVRSYSLSSGPSETTYRISVKRDGLASTHLHTKLSVGDVLEVAAPRGDFVLAPGAGPLLLVSAGIGVTPVLAMLHRLAADRSPREIWWLHAAHDADEQAFAAEAHDLLSSLPNAHEQIFLSDSRRLTADCLTGLGLPRDATAYVCGPEAFMADIGRALTDHGADVHTELFGGRERLNPGVAGAAGALPHQPGGEPGRGPLVTFARSGLAVRWRDNETSLLELAEASDVPTRWSCRTGVCHNCVTPLLSGEVEYRPEPLESPAGGEVLICCSRPAGDVVLDL
ncbi:MOSC and FAD-binding oxidoreductase domain-containing protein [Actinoplanes sp. NPDC049596]|uniref:MOSC and FAD-binding oxidoreductase domain-containing protein n=1 Tax=unclassified Actinoplanes TaxID=2626549 RepID=UPI00343667A4